MSFEATRDRTLAILTIYGEASGEPHAGKIAVAWVLRNRLRSGHFGNTLAAVCLAKSQFSCWLSGPDRDRMMVGHDPAYDDCAEAFDAVMAGFPDPTGGATFYFADSIAPPPWAATMKETAHIGHHRLFRPA